MTRHILACAAVLLCFATAVHATAAAPKTTEAAQATNYIRSLQNTDGGFPLLGAESSASGTLEAVLAYAAFGTDPRTIEKSGTSPDAYLATQAASYVVVPGNVPKLVTGLAAMDIDPASFGGVDVLAAMEANYTAATGKYGDDIFAQSLFILAERSLDRTVPAAAATYLISQQKDDGGWEYCCGFGTDTNTTAIAVRALVAAGVPVGDPAIVAAVTYLKANQNADGGFRYSAPFDSDPSSTAYVIQAITSLEQSAEAGGPWDLGGGANPLGTLVSFQNPVTGALQAFGSDNAFATYQGVPGLMLAAFPEQSEPDKFTPTSTSTPTSTPTSSSTATATPTAALTPTRTTTPARSTTTTVQTPGPTSVSTVLAATAQPTMNGSITGLPQTGSGPGAGESPLNSIALLISGVSFASAGVLRKCRRRLV